MTHKPPENDPRQIWQSQRTEQRIMSLEDIRRRSRKLQAGTRNRMIAGILIGAVFIIRFSMAFAGSQDPIRLAFLGLVIIGVVTMLLMQFQTLKKLRAGPPATNVASVSVDFYRGALQAQRDSYRRIGWAVMPFLLGIALFVFQGAMRIVNDQSITPTVRAILPFTILLIAWGVLFIYFGRRGQRWLRRELEALDAYDKENRS